MLSAGAADAQFGSFGGETIGGAQEETDQKGHEVNRLTPRDTPKDTQRDTPKDTQRGRENRVEKTLFLFLGRLTEPSESGSGIKGSKEGRGNSMEICLPPRSLCFLALSFNLSGGEERTTVKRRREEHEKGKGVYLSTSALIASKHDGGSLLLGFDGRDGEGHR